MMNNKEQKVYNINTILAGTFVLQRARVESWPSLG
jgi:hypothetical protein